MLATLEVHRRDGVYAVVTLDGNMAAVSKPGVDAIIRETEGWTAIATADVAQRNGWAFDSTWAWLTLEVFSALEAVGLTAAVSTALAAADIPCNMVAGFHHDHMLVPVAKADLAMTTIRGLSDGA